MTYTVEGLGTRLRCGIGGLFLVMRYIPLSLLKKPLRNFVGGRGEERERLRFRSRSVYVLISLRELYRRRRVAANDVTGHCMSDVKHVARSNLRESTRQLHGQDILP